MEHYLPRLVDSLLEEYLAELSAVMIVGPRACGKTTTALRYARTVVRLDSEDDAAAFRASPDAALRAREEPVLLDEWQLLPEVLGAVKRADVFELGERIRAAPISTLWTAGTG